MFKKVTKKITYINIIILIFSFFDHFYGSQIGNGEFSNTYKIYAISKTFFVTK